LEEKLKKREEELRDLQDTFNKLQDEIKELNERLNQARDDMEKFTQEAENLKKQLSTAETLVYLLTSSKANWTTRKNNLEIQYENLVGDSLISAAFLSYAGPFPAEYRDRLTSEVLLKQVKGFFIKHSKDYKFTDFLSKPA
jgi:dynein heavy chain